MTKPNKQLTKIDAVEVVSSARENAKFSSFVLGGAISTEEKNMPRLPGSGNHVADFHEFIDNHFKEHEQQEEEAEIGKDDDYERQIKVHRSK